MPRASATQPSPQALTASLLAHRDGGGLSLAEHRRRAARGPRRPSRRNRGQASADVAVVGDGARQETVPAKAEPAVHRRQAKARRRRVSTSGAPRRPREARRWEGGRCRRCRPRRRRPAWRQPAGGGPRRPRALHRGARRLLELARPKEGRKLRPVAGELVVPAARVGEGATCQALVVVRPDAERRRGDAAVARVLHLFGDALEVLARAVAPSNISTTRRTMLSGARRRRLRAEHEGPRGCWCRPRSGWWGRSPGAAPHVAHGGEGLHHAGAVAVGDERDLVGVAHLLRPSRAPTGGPARSSRRHRADTSSTRPSRRARLALRRQGLVGGRPEPAYLPRPVGLDAPCAGRTIRGRGRRELRPRRYSARVVVTSWTGSRCGAAPPSWSARRPRSRRRQGTRPTGGDGASELLLRRRGARHGGGSLWLLRAGRTSARRRSPPRRRVRRASRGLGRPATATAVPLDGRPTRGGLTSMHFVMGRGGREAVRSAQ